MNASGLALVRCGFGFKKFCDKRGMMVWPHQLRVAYPSGAYHQSAGLRHCSTVIPMPTRRTGGRRSAGTRRPVMAYRQSQPCHPGMRTGWMDGMDGDGQDGPDCAALAGLGIDLHAPWRWLVRIGRAVGPPHPEMFLNPGRWPGLVCGGPLVLWNPLFQHKLLIDSEVAGVAP